MASIEDIVKKAVKRLRRKGKLESVALSASRQKEAGISLSDVDEHELLGYLGGLANCAYFHGIEPAKESWRQINGTWRPIVNAGIIEAAKIMPYLPWLDKNRLYRMIGIKIGENATIAPRVQFDYFHPELIEIGDNCLIGDGAKIWTHDYGTDYFMIASVKIGNNVRVGSESAIWGPSEIGNDVIMNYGCLVQGEIPAGARLKGNEKNRRY